MTIRNRHGALQFVAVVAAVAQLDAIFFTGVPIVVQVRPIMHDQQVVVALGGDRLADLGPKRLGQVREGNGRIMEKTPGGLRAGETLSAAGQRVRARSDPLRDLEMFFD